MVARWGMDPEIGPIDLRNSEESPFLGRKIAQPVAFADDTAGHVDQAVMTILQDAATRAQTLIEQHQDRIAILIARLEAEETLDASAIRDCLDPGNVTPLRKPRRNGNGDAGD
ncbi:ATP-dependent zinc metalloprotease FtsH [Boseongicola aestuarii]|uniref:ATP-dependent zinc metalloprotease FtsH n=1 Tax=Boseongicola aestuarii TaxID=1470561 RepID=A0A238J4Z0_9RHOB|nr:ATP-dependent zinc metalloprotease FtsH [Boseongicola aestuarii]